MYIDPKRSLNDLREIHKVYEAFRYILNSYTWGKKDENLKEVLLQTFEGYSKDTINLTIQIALHEYDPFLYQVYNAIIDFEASGKKCFECKNHRKQLERVMQESKKAIKETRLNEIHDKLHTENSETPDETRGQNRRIEKERRKKECYRLYDELEKNESKDTEPLRKAKIARKLGVTTKTITRYLQERE